MAALLLVPLVTLVGVPIPAQRMALTNHSAALTVTVTDVRTMVDLADLAVVRGDRLEGF